MIDKRVVSAVEAVTDVFDGATVMVGGFGDAGSPVELLHALIDQGARDLTVISNNAGSGSKGLAALIGEGRVTKIICSFPRAPDSTAFSDRYSMGRIELELVPQGTLAERIRAAGAGIPAVYTPTGVGTLLAEGKEQRVIDGQTCLLEHALSADFALIKARHADRYGNLLYNKTARNFGPIMAMAARTTIAQVSLFCSASTMDPEAVATPGIFVQRVVEIPKQGTVHVAPAAAPS